MEEVRRLPKGVQGNNGVDCTWCCNKAAHNGHDIFAPHGRPMSDEAREYLHQFYQRLAVPAIAPIDNFVPYIPPTARTTRVRRATTAPVPRK